MTSVTETRVIDPFGPAGEGAAQLVEEQPIETEASPTYHSLNPAPPPIDESAVQPTVYAEPAASDDVGTNDEYYDNSGGDDTFRTNFEAGSSQEEYNGQPDMGDREFSRLQNELDKSTEKRAQRYEQDAINMLSNRNIIFETRSPVVCNLYTLDQLHAMDKGIILFNHVQ